MGAFRITIIGGLGLILGASLCLAAPDKIAAEIGTVIEGLEFKDIRYLRRELRDFGDKRAFVFVGTNSTCPLVQRYVPKLNRLQAEYAAQDVQFISLNVAPAESIAAMAAHAIEMKVQFPTVKDLNGECVRRLGLTRTPEVAVLDSDYRLVYRGRIDDQYRVGGARPNVSEDNLHVALKAIVTGQPVEITETPTEGCLIAKPPQLPNLSLTYADVAPIIKQNCVECHRPGTEAPFSLGTYADVAAQTETIAEVVDDRRMPPWYGGPEDKDFVNHRGLTDDERLKIVNWVASGAIRGQVFSEPALAPPENGAWTIGQPDLIIRTPMADEIPSDGYVPYRYAVLEHAFEADTYVNAIQITSDNPNVLHHCNLIGVPPGKTPLNAQFITGKVPGSQPLVTDPRVAVKIPVGTTLMLQIHFTTTGKPETCRISVGMKFAGGVVDKQFRHILMKSSTFAIPPGHSNYEVKQGQVIDRPTTGIGLFTHMHLRGKDMKFLVDYPAGNTETLLTVPNYNFDWQMGYRWAPGARRFPAGSRFHVVAHFDNSLFNPFNPDPTATVREGRQTFHEMMYGFYFFTYDDEQLNLNIDGKTGHVLPAG